MRNTIFDPRFVNLKDNADTSVDDDDDEDDGSPCIVITTQDKEKFQNGCKAINEEMSKVSYSLN